MNEMNSQRSYSYGGSAVPFFLLARNINHIVNFFGRFDDLIIIEKLLATYHDRNNITS